MNSSRATRNVPNAVIVLTLVIACASAFVRTTTAQEPTEDKLPDQLHAFHLQELARYNFQLDRSADKPLQFVKTPVMTWQGDGDWFGDLFVWTYQGRPQVIGCIGTWKASVTGRGVFHEFQSLATAPLSPVTIGKRQSWSAERGITLQEVEGVTAPGKAVGQRSIQMRNIARSLEVKMESETGLHELRLLPKPLVRYESNEQGVIDGAIFSFVWTNGTDPEFLLVVEARENDGRVDWVYAPARFTYRPLTVTREGSELWDIARHEADYQSPRLSTPYVTLRVDNVQLTDLAEIELATSVPEESE